MSPSKSPTPLALFGANGLLAGELMRLLETHPSLALAVAATREGGSLAESQPHLASPANSLPIEQAIGRCVELASRGPLAIAFALPHGESATLWKSLRSALGENAKNAVVVDLGADYRLADEKLYASVYGAPHPDALELPRFVYGLPEFHRDELKNATRAAAGGCFATAMQLAVLPAYEAGLADLARPIVIVGITGSSGSGNKPAANTHHPHRAGNLWAYSLQGHRHEAELAQTLARRGRRNGELQPTIHFVPHSGPFVRGIHLTAVVPLLSGVNGVAARDAYRARYESEPFIQVLEKGVTDLRRVVGSNRACMALDARGDLLTVCLTLDNITKGGAGQALQCLNLMLGVPETSGLPQCGLGVTG